MAAILALRPSRSRSGSRRQANWDLPLLGILLGFSVFSDLTAIPTASRVKISGSFLALTLAMVFLGGAPAALIGAITILAGWLRWRDEPHDLLNNLATYATFPLVGGIAFDGRRPRRGVTADDPAFYLLVFGVFLLALAINFAMIGGYTCYLERSSFVDKVRTALVPLLPSELAAALMAVGVAFIYVKIGIAGGRPVRHRAGHLPVPARRAAALPAAGRGAGEAQQAARQLPGRDDERAAAHPRPAGPDDRPPQRRRRPLLARDRGAGRLLEEDEELVHIAACCTTSASSSSPTGSSRPTCRSPTRTGC